MGSDDVVGLKEKLSVEKYRAEDDMPRWFGCLLDEIRIAMNQLDNVEYETRGLNERSKEAQVDLLAIRDQLNQIERNQKDLFALQMETIATIDAFAKTFGLEKVKH